ncbi:MAG: ATP-binding cassette domain-containing protein [Deltaproteobacteria bacterium]|jgi:NitT/TauT family transport system ATP-binding protein|nr:ATP-binding cassette domain-containing protein [Deltaproteobacteria bacterium]
MIRIDRLNAGYGPELVLRDFSLELEDGEIHALIGPSGCGKSTLLKVLCGIIPPLAGRIEYAAGQGGGPPDIGYVPQHYGLLAWKTVLRNILLPLRVGSGRRKISRREETGDIIDALGLRPLLQRYPRELSGGERQRAALARALISGPGLLLMDEPFSALDAFTADACRELFFKLWGQYRVTTLLITHSMAEAAALGSRILLMNPYSRQISLRLRNDNFGDTGAAGQMALAAHIQGLFKDMLAAGGTLPYPA